jgi:hypothetical protein
MKENEPEKYAKSLETKRKYAAKGHAKQAAAKQKLKTEDRNGWEQQQQVKRDYEKAAYSKRSTGTSALGRNTRRSKSLTKRSVYPTA